MISPFALPAGLAILGATLAIMYLCRNFRLPSSSSFWQRVQWVLFVNFLILGLVLGLVLIVYSLASGTTLDELAFIIMIIPFLSTGASIILLSLMEPGESTISTIRGLLIMFAGMCLVLGTIFLSTRLI